MDNNDSINQQQSPTTTDSIINQTKAPNCSREPNKILNSWLHLQKIIKEEITLGDTIKKHQVIYQRELYNYYYSYYESKLKTRETLENVVNIDNNIYKLQYFKLVANPEDILRDTIDPIRNLLILLRGNFDCILKTITLIDESDSKSDPAWNTLIELFCHQFYDNLLIPDPEQEDLLRLCYMLIAKEISYMNSASVYSFIDENSSFAGKFLKSYTKKQELKSYLSMTLRSLIHSIENANDNCFDLNPSRIQLHLQKQGMKDKGSVFKFDNVPIDELLTSEIPSTSIALKEQMYEDDNDEEKKGLLLQKCNSKAKVHFFEFKAAPIKINNDYSIDITQEELSQRIENESDKDLRDFYIRQLERINKDPEIFTNKKFFQSIDDLGELKSAILKKYKDNFIQIKAFIDNIIQSLLDKITTIPYTLRCICKVIHILIKAKFPMISAYEVNAFIGEFIFGKCILPILINSDINAFITSSILSLNTRHCLKIITKVLTRINRGLFFEATLDTDFTIFNHYIIEVIPLINEFYKQLIDIQLPKVIEEMIKAQIDKGFDDTSLFKMLNKKNKQAMMMKKNSNDNENAAKEIMAMNSNSNSNARNNANEKKEDIKKGIKHVHCCICYSIEDILLLLKIIKPKVKEYLKFENGSFLEKTIEKIYDKEYDLIEIQRKSNHRQFFLYFREPPNADLYSSNVSNYTKHTSLNDNEDSNLVLQRIKFCIIKVLTGLNLIDSKDYSYFVTDTSNKDFLNSLRKTLKELEEYNENEFINAIPLKWYSGYIYNNRKLLPENYKDNDYALLYKELLNEEQSELQYLKQNSSVIITKNGMNVRFAEKLVEKATRDLIRVQRIDQFMKIEKFITNTRIEVCFTHETDKDHLNTMSSNQNDQRSFFNFFTHKANQIDIDDDKPRITITPIDKCMHKRLSFIKNESKNQKGFTDRHAHDIKEFIYKFSQYKEITEDIERSVPTNKIYQTLESYLDLVKEKVKTDSILKLEKEAEVKVIMERIGDHIMKSMYNEVFPKKQITADIVFEKKTEELSFITPAHLEIKAIYVNELKSATEYVRRINEGKSGYEKLQFIEMAHNTINNTIKFSSGKNEEAGADELSPLFHYIIIKAKPSRFYSNINYINTFLPPNLLNGRYGFLLAQMESSAEFIMKIDIQTLDKAKEEFEKKVKSVKSVS